MINRREVLASALAVSLLGSAAEKSKASAQHPAGDERFAFAADSRLPYARSAARAAAGGGAVVLFTDADVTALYAALDHAWRDAPFAIAGATTVSALFAIERLARDRGLRGVYRGLHRKAGGHALQGERLGPPALLERIDKVSATDAKSATEAAAYAANLGRALVAWGLAGHQLTRALPALGPPGGAHGSAEFASWLFVPKKRA